MYSYYFSFKIFLQNKCILNFNVRNNINITFFRNKNNEFKQIKIRFRNKVKEKILKHSILYLFEIHRCQLSMMLNLVYRVTCIRKGKFTS